MKKTVLTLMAVCLFAGNASAQSADYEQQFFIQEQDLQVLEPTYLENVYVNNPWDSNWFFSIKGGMSAFVGKPVGCGDFFNRTEPLVNFSAGKWITPFFGGRLSYQGLKLKDYNTIRRPFQNLHADLLYNLSSHFRQGFETLPKWDLIAYAGCGIIRNSYTHEKPFALSYGVIGRYRIADRVHVAGELGGTTTWQNFDGAGKANKLGDGLYHASIGLEFTFGKVGFKKVIDPKPYIAQNDILLSYIDKLKDDNTMLRKIHARESHELMELKKILEIEGLLDQYEIGKSGLEKSVRVNPKNNYSGLNALRKRMANKDWNGDPNTFKPVLASTGSMELTDTTKLSPEQYIKAVKNGKTYIGSPIYFFFKLNTTDLTEKSQHINIREIANVMKKYGLYAKIVGAADSQTGTPKRNESLSSRRADFLAEQLVSNGVDMTKIERQHRGGISEYKPQEGNRNTCVLLYIK